MKHATSTIKAMNIEDIKEGEMYNVRVKVVSVYNNAVDAMLADATDTIVNMHIPEQRVSILHPISSETAPEHGANRLLRKGDIVTPVSCKGRKPWGRVNGGHNYANPRWKCEVVNDECQGYVEVRTQSGFEFEINACFLELVIPREKREPFHVERDDEDGCYFVQKDDGEMSAVDTLVQAFYFKTEDYNAHYYTEGQAEELANETCKRLNAEWRKEQENA